MRTRHNVDIRLSGAQLRVLSRIWCLPARPWVLALAGTAPYPTLASVGLAVGVSRERVRQILRRAGRTEYGLMAHRVHKRLVHICPDCGGRKAAQASRCQRCWGLARAYLRRVALGA